MRPNLTTMLVFTKSTLAAIRLALSETTPKAQKMADYAAYANARALGRAAIRILEDA